MHAREMIGTHPQVRGNTNDALIRFIEACYDCAQTCTTCAAWARIRWPSWSNASA